MSRPAALGLSPREQDVLRLIADGRTDKEIAWALTMSIQTVKNHGRSIRIKLRCGTRTEAAAVAFRSGLVV